MRYFPSWNCADEIAKKIRKTAENLQEIAEIADKLRFSIPSPERKDYTKYVQIDHGLKYKKTAQIFKQLKCGTTKYAAGDPKKSLEMCVCFTDMCSLHS